MIHEGIWKCPTPWISKHVSEIVQRDLQATCSIIKTSRNNLQSCASVNHLSDISQSFFGNVKIWGLDTQIWFWILWQSSYRLGTMTIGACYTSSKSSKLFAGEIMVCPVLFAPLKAVEVRSSVVLLPCVLGSMAYLPQWSHREPSIKLGFLERSKTKFRGNASSDQIRKSCCCLCSLRNFNKMLTKGRIRQGSVDGSHMDVPWSVSHPVRRDCKFCLWLKLQTERLFFIHSLLILLWFWFIFFSQVLHRWSCQSRCLGVSVCSEWPIFCTCLQKVSTKIRS